MLSDRKKKILCAVVDGYIANATPISSKQIQTEYLCDCSSATIRNELSALESMGYLIQPHVSAGRIPSEKAFKYYVGDIMCNVDLASLNLADRLEHRFSRHAHTSDDVMNEVAKVISDVTNYTAVVVKEDLSDTITAIRLVDLFNGKMLAVIVTDSRVMTDGLVDVPADFTQTMMEQAEQWLNKIFVGKHVSEFLNFDYPFALFSGGYSQYNALFKKIIDVLKKVALANGMDVDMYGQSKILQHSEYKDVHTAQKFLNQMENKLALAQMLTNDGGTNGSVTIKIGANDSAPEGCSVVSTRVQLGRNISSAIGVIGPVRMDYKKVLCVLEKISNIIINMISKENK